MTPWPWTAPDSKHGTLDLGLCLEGYFLLYSGLTWVYLV